MCVVGLHWTSMVLDPLLRGIMGCDEPSYKCPRYSARRHKVSTHTEQPQPEIKKNIFEKKNITFQNKFVLDITNKVMKVEKRI